MTHDAPSNLPDRIRAARTTHAQLRAAAPTPRNLDEKRPLFESLKSLFDELWSDAEQMADQRAAGSLRSAIRALTVDAESFAGLQGEAEGYRDAGDVSDAYDLLERHFSTRA